MNKKSFMYIKISAVLLIISFVSSFFWSQNQYAMPSILGMVTIILATAYFVFGAMCSFTLSDKEQKKEQLKKYNEDNHYFINNKAS